MKKIILPVVVTMLTLSTAAWAKPADKGIAAYNAKQYSDAIPLLQDAVAANPKDGTAHYYLALSNQALGRRAEAEREYRWNYDNGTDKDLKYKSWQGLVALSRSKAGPRGATVSVAANNGNIPMLKAGSSPWASRTEKATANKVESGFVRGCFKH
jgi:tetratricopeptide (TPR) repeat protein